ncbi:MAG: photosystem II stability/assembly factor-like uncharacterized protein [Spirosomataceae bacterium]|jgi:photosystem II stability/assembly factor-like uncharacterized protein
MKKHLLLLFLLLSATTLFAQRKSKRTATEEVAKSSVDKPALPLQTLKWRNIGPFRGGRSLAVAGHQSDPLTYYFGAVGGGVWKTTDGGANWSCISDSVFQSSSVGAITVAPSDPNVVYVGMGEADMRSNISFGDGMYKSTDGGKTWKHIGLRKADAISTIAVHPKDENTLFVASVGNPFASNPERGVFKSTDGGESWKHVLAIDDSTGAYHVKIDVNNPRIVYATTWQAYRNGHSMSSGGKGCGIYKSTDGGETWLPIHKNPGLPKGMLGKMGIAVSPANSNRLYAIIENKNGGLFTSTDAGEHWTLVNDDKNLWQRPWYYMNIAADPKNEMGIFVLNVSSFKSEDGGKNFNRISVNHGDTHDIWVNPDNPKNYIIGDDGGGEVTFNDGKIFSEQDYPTAQFYHVSVDNDFPYNIYGAQQDNSSVRISSRSKSYGITERDWYPVAGGEAGYIESDPRNSKITYGGEYDGSLSRHDAETGENRDISVYPESNMGHTSAMKKYRFQWTYPIVFSPHNPQKLYVTSQYVHVSMDEGQSWKVISPDLSRNDPKTTGNTGGPITLDQTGAEIYATIYSLAESKTEPGLIWTGSDDGLIHVSKDDGANWENVSIPTSLLPDFAMISIIHPSETVKGKVYVTATRYMSGDRKPYLFKSNDYGKSWTAINNGIPADEYTRVMREDPTIPGLLYAGTERGIYYSVNDGSSWESLKSNLPITSVRDLQVQARESDLVIATHGRSFWVMDDLTPLYSLIKNKDIAEKEMHVFEPKPTYRMKGGGRQRGNAAYGENPASGVVINYHLKEQPEKELKLVFMDAAKDTIVTYSSKYFVNGKPPKSDDRFYEDEDKEPNGILTTDKGMNQFEWNMRHKSATPLKGADTPIWSGSTSGPKVPPGSYTVTLTNGDELVQTINFEIVPDPSIKTSKADFAEQYALSKKTFDKLDETHKGVNKLRDIKSSIEKFNKSVSDSTLKKEFTKFTKPTVSKIDSLEQLLVQNKAVAFQDLLAYPIRLNDKLAGVKSAIESADAKPTAGTYEVLASLSSQVDAVLKEVTKIEKEFVPEFNHKVKENNIPAIVIE